MEQGEKCSENRWGTADLWAGYFVARRSQPHCGDSFRRGTNPSSRVGFPSPPPVSFPTRDERFAIRGASSPNLWQRHPRLFMRRLRPIVGWLAQGSLVFVYHRGGIVGLGRERVLW